MLRRGCACVLALGVAWVPAAPAWALAGPPPTSEDERVEALNRKAVERYQAGDYAGTVDAFEAAYALSPEPNYLFNIGRVYEDLSDYGKAVEYYERFLAQGEVDEASKKVALERLEVIRPLVPTTEVAPPVRDEERPPTDEAAGEPADEDTASDPSQGDDAPTDRSRNLRIGGFTLLGLGIAGLGAATGLALSARSQSRKLADLNTLESRDDAIDKGRTRAIAADALFVTGGVLAATGIILTVVGYTRGRKSDDRVARRAKLSPQIGLDGVGAHLDVRF